MLLLFNGRDDLAVRAQDVLNSHGIGAVLMDEDELEIRGDDEDAQAALEILKRNRIPFEVAED